MEEEHENEERWLLTYADLITLLMAFFMVMFAMSQLDAKRFEQLAGSLSDAFSNPMGGVLNLGGMPSGRISVMPRSAKDPESQKDATTRSRYRMIEDMKGQFQQLIKEGGLEASVTVSTNPEGNRLVVRLSNSLLFLSGSAQLSDQAKEVIGQVADILVKAGKPVSIEGHTDNIAPSGGMYKSNWELATARATNVLVYLVENYGMPPEKLSAGGYGEYRPIASNDTPEGRAQNRRVEFVVLSDERPQDEAAKEETALDATL